MRCMTSKHVDLICLLQAQKLELEQSCREILLLKEATQLASITASADSFRKEEHTVKQRVEELNTQYEALQREIAQLSSTGKKDLETQEKCIECAKLEVTLLFNLLLSPV